jgi:hypothetical protein
MIYITGDTHIPIDIHKLKNQFFNPPGATKSNTYLIICGDFGAVWNYKGEDKEEKYWIGWRISHIQYYLLTETMSAIRD